MIVKENREERTARIIRGLSDLQRQINSGRRAGDLVQEAMAIRSEVLKLGRVSVALRQAETDLDRLIAHLNIMSRRAS